MDKETETENSGHTVLEHHEDECCEDPAAQGPGLKSLRAEAAM